jgi:hypothetical protein
MPVGFETSDPPVYVAVTSLLSLVVVPAALRRTLSKSAFGELKRKHRGAALERAIAEWIAEHDKQ